MGFIFIGGGERPKECRDLEQVEELKEETDRTGSILKAGLHPGPDCGL